MMAKSAKPSAEGNSGIADILASFLRKSLFRILSVGPIPSHIAFIMDGNRRYAKKHNMEEGEGHKSGFSSLMSLLKHCYELGVKYVTVYAFSIDNFRRKPEEVGQLMDLMLEKIESLIEEESLVNQYGVRVYFIGDLKLLDNKVRIAAEKLMEKTSRNSTCTLMVCIAYTSTDEILHAVREVCDCGENNGITVDDIEREMYMAVAPEPDVMIRSSGEMRLSNFLLWQSGRCCLYSPKALWPEIGFRHLVFAVLIYQRSVGYFEKMKKEKLS